MRIDCDFFRIGVMANFNALSDYINYVEGWIQESHHSTLGQILSENRTPPSASEESLQEWLGQQQKDIDECDRRYTVDFRRILRFTALMSIYTLVESNLSSLVHEIANRKGLSLDMEDLQAKNLAKRFEKFWTKVARLQWWPDTRWDELKDLEELRNCIAHRNGVIRASDGRVKQLLRHDSGVRLVGLNNHLVDPDEGGTLEIERRFC